VGRFAQSIATLSVYAIVARDPEAADVRQPAFPLAFGRHSSALRSLRRAQFANFSTLILKPHLFLFDKG
jgi:hypothetical protein